MPVHFAARLRRSQAASNARHAHPDQWQAEYVAAGSIVYDAGGSERRLGPGGLIVVPPGLPHRQESAASADSFLLRFAHPAARALLSDAAAVAALPRRERGRAETLLASIVAERDGRADAREFMLDALLGQFLVCARRWAGVGARPVDPARRRVRAVADLLRRRYAERFAVADLAARACLSRSRFMELFREEMGAAPGEFHRRVQMEKAVELARYTDMTWQQISRHLGFDDPSYFSRAFKKVMGLSPSQFLARRRAAE